jgi:hypothetical protein
MSVFTQQNRLYPMQAITKRLSSLIYLARPLALTFVGIVLVSIGVAYILLWMSNTLPFPTFFYYVTLEFIPEGLRGLLLMALGLIALIAGIWKLSGVVVVPLHGQHVSGSEIVVGYRFDKPRIAVLSGGAGMLVLSDLSRHAEKLTCITPLQEPIEYYYRASSLFQAQNVDYVVPTPTTPRVVARLDNGSLLNVMHVDHYPELAGHHVTQLLLDLDAPSPHESNQNGHADPEALQRTANLPLSRPAHDALHTADAIVIGPGSLFESVLPNLLLDELRDAIKQSPARKIYICNLMTEPGLTTGFSVADHIRHIKEYGGFTPDYVLVNAQRIESGVQQLYAQAHQAPVYLTPEEYEETAVAKTEQMTRSHLQIEGSVVIESDLASSVIQYKASINNPSESRAVRVLRHDPEKLTAAILELLRNE